MVEQLKSSPSALAKSLEKLVVLPPPVGHPDSLGSKNSHSYHRMMQLVNEQVHRNREPLRSYVAMPQVDAFHASTAYIRLLIGSNRAGKTIGAVTEFARAISGQDPYGKYPVRDGRAYVVGKSLRHIGDTLFTKMFKPGLIRVIQNELGEWEAYRPWSPAHMGRYAETRPSAPLIPKRMVADWSFEKKATGEIEYLRMTNGWEILFFAAKGNRPQGNDVDLVWLDEEIVNSVEGPWIPEMMARTVDRGGRIMWSAAPQSGYDNLQDLSDRAEKQDELWRSNPAIHPVPDIVQFNLKIEDNIYQVKENVSRFERNLSEEERLIRFEGQSAANSRRVYPEFKLRMHGYPIHVIPDHWSRYAYIDPGFVICGALFIAVPPLDECPGKLPTLICYDEMYIPECDAKKYGKNLATKTGGPKFEAFIGDRHGLAPTESGSGKTVESQYIDAMIEEKISSHQTGSGFRYANDDRRAGVLMVKKMLQDREGGRPQFLVAVDPEDETSCRVPNLVSEIKRFRKKVVAGHLTDDTEDRGYTHLCQCMRYACMDDPQWVRRSEKSTSVKLFEEIQAWKARINARNGAGQRHVNFGSS